MADGELIRGARAKADAEAAPRLAAVGAVIVSGVLAVMSGAWTVALVRETLHIRCEMGPPGSEGADTWTCSDGIGYLGVAVDLGAMWAIALVAGALVAGLARRARPARIALVALSGLSAAWMFGWTAYGSNELVGDAFSALTGMQYWAQAVGSAAVVSAFGLVVAAMGLLFSGLAARVLHGLGAAALVIACALQPGIGITVLAAAGLLAAASFRATTHAVSDGIL